MAKDEGIVKPHSRTKKHKCVYACVCTVQYAQQHNMKSNTRTQIFTHIHIYTHFNKKKEPRCNCALNA